MEAQFLVLLKYPFKTHTSTFKQILSKLSGFNLLTPHEAIYVGSVEATYLTHKPSYKDKDLEPLVWFTQNFSYCFDNILILKELLDKDPSHYNDYEHYFFQACERGHLNVARWLMENHLIGMTRYDQNKIVEKCCWEACAHGHLKMAMWLWDLMDLCNYSLNKNDYNRAFLGAIQNNHFQAVQWMLNLGLRLDHRACNDKPFVFACLTGNIHMVKLIWNIDPQNRPNHRTDDDYMFKLACIKNNLKLAQWLWEVEPHNRPNCQIDDNITFIDVCINGNLKMAKWLLSIYNLGPKPKFRKTSNVALYYACLYENFHIVRWLMSLPRRIRPNPCKEKNRIFWNVCIWGNLYMAQWFMTLPCSIRPNLHNMGDNDVFKAACRNGHLKLAQWLYSLPPSIFPRPNMEDAGVFINGCLMSEPYHIVEWIRKVCFK